MWLSDEVVEHLRALAGEPVEASQRYEILREIGRGGMGTIYDAADAVLDRRVALKVLGQVRPHENRGRRFLREAKVIAQLEHPGIVPIHDMGELPDGRVFYTMKLVHGMTLEQVIKDPPPLPDLLRIFSKTCEAVAFAHAHGVIHRDLTPRNIMVGSFGEALVMDWGLAKVLDGAEGEPFPEEAVGARSTELPRNPSIDSEQTADGSILGTPSFMAPEQARGEVTQLGPPVDIYSLGAILYFILTGHPPYSEVSKDGVLDQVRRAPPPRPRQRSPAVPKALEAICLRALARNPEARYESAMALGADVGRFLDGLPTDAYRENLVERIWRVIVRHRVLVVLVLSYLVMRLLVLFLLGP